MKKSTWKLILSIISITIPVLVFINIFTEKNFKKSGSSQLAFEEKAYYCAEKNGKFIELTQEGNLYEHDFKGKPKCIKEDTDIIFIAESEDPYDYNSQLIIKKNGNIYVSQNHDYQGKKIGTIKEAVSGSMSKTNIGILTKKGELYVYGKNDSGALGLEEIKDVKKLTQVKDIPKVKKVICKSYHTVIISFEGKIYGCGKFIMNEYSKFKKLSLKNKAKDIDSTGGTIVALDYQGNLYELGYSLHDTPFQKEYSEFTEIKEKSNTAEITAGLDLIVAFGNDFQISYWGSKNVGKATGISVSGELKEIRNLKHIFCQGRYLYLLTDRTVIRYHFRG